MPSQKVEPNEEIAQTSASVCQARTIEKNSETSCQHHGEERHVYLEFRLAVPQAAIT